MILEIGDLRNAGCGTAGVKPCGNGKTGRKGEGDAAERDGKYLEENCGFHKR